MSDPSLFAALDQVPDFRHASGKRHRLQAILALAVSAMLCGARSLSAIAQWGRDYGPELTEWLGFPLRKGRVRTPWVATLHRVFKRLDVAAFEAVLQQWSLACLAATPGGAQGDPPPEVIALDGKTLRGTLGHQLPGVPLLAAFSQRLGLPLAQSPVDSKTNEAKAVLPLLKSLVLKGTILTGDAMFTQREICELIVERGGDSVLTVKANPETLEQEIATLLPDPPPSRSGRQARSGRMAAGWSGGG